MLIRVVATRRTCDPTMMVGACGDDVAYQARLPNDTIGHRNVQALITWVGLVAGPSSSLHDCYRRLFCPQKLSHFRSESGQALIDILRIHGRKKHRGLRRKTRPLVKNINFISLMRVVIVT